MNLRFSIDKLINPGADLTKTSNICKMILNLIILVQREHVDIKENPITLNLISF